MPCQQVSRSSRQRAQGANQSGPDTPQVGAVPVEQRDSSHKARPGRPRKYETPEAMELAIDRYFLIAKKPTMTKLARALGFRNRQGLHAYAGYGEEFSYIVKRAHLRMEAYYEEKLRDKDARVSEVIRALKRLGWQG
jgi:hypothetical protein